MSRGGSAAGQPMLAIAAFQAALARRVVAPHACVLLLIFFLAPAAHAQFNLFLVDGSTEQPAPAVYDFGSLYAGETASAHFRVRNTSSAASTLTTLAVAGVGFTLTSPTLPVGVAPQGAVDLTVAFSATNAGAYSASLHSDGIAILLTATLAPRLTYRIDAPGAVFPGPVDFGSVITGSGAARGITFRNETSLVLTVPAITVHGTDFSLQAAAPSGQTLQPGQGGEFTILFAPQATGAHQGSLILGDRTYPLLGTGIDPPLPKPTVSLDLKQAASAQQGTLIVHFDAPAQSPRDGHRDLGFPGRRRFRHGVRVGWTQRHFCDRSRRRAGSPAIPDGNHRRRADLHRASGQRKRPPEHLYRRRSAGRQYDSSDTLARRRGNRCHRL